MDNFKKNLAILGLGSILTFGGVTLTEDKFTIENAEQAWRPVNSTATFYFVKNSRNELVMVGFQTRDIEELERDPQELYEEYLSKPQDYEEDI